MFREAARLQPDHPEHPHNLAVTLLSAGDAEAAVAQLERAVTLDPLYDRSWLLLTQIVKPELRTQTIERYLKVVPQNLTFHQALKK